MNERWNKLEKKVGWEDITVYISGIVAIGVCSYLLYTAKDFYRSHKEPKAEYITNYTNGGLK